MAMCVQDSAALVLSLEEIEASSAASRCLEAEVYEVHSEGIEALAGGRAILRRGEGFAAELVARLGTLEATHAALAEDLVNSLGRQQDLAVATEEIDDAAAAESCNPSISEQATAVELPVCSFSTGLSRVLRPSQRRRDGTDQDSLGWANGNPAHHVLEDDADEYQSADEGPSLLSPKYHEIHEAEMLRVQLESTEARNAHIWQVASRIRGAEAKARRSARQRWNESEGLLARLAAAESGCRAEASRSGEVLAKQERLITEVRSLESEAQRSLVEEEAEASRARQAHLLTSELRSAIARAKVDCENRRIYREGELEAACRRFELDLQEAKISEARAHQAHQEMLARSVARGENSPASSQQPSFSADAKDLGAQHPQKPAKSRCMYWLAGGRA